MSKGNTEPGPSERWEKLFKDALFEGDVQRMPRRIELAKHAIVNRLEDATCEKTEGHFSSGELLALREARRTLKVLEQLYPIENESKMTA